MTDAKITALVATTAPVTSDLLAIVTNVSTTPTTKKVELTYIKDFILTNYQISPTITSSNLTVALKNQDGSNPSTSEPVTLKIHNTVRSVTGALSVTVNAGTDTFNSGDPMLAAKTVDYFVYLAYDSADAVTAIGFSRIPYVRDVTGFSGTATAETYCAWSSAPGSGDYCELIGRFSAVMSASPGYTWSDVTDIVHRPIFTTKWLTWTPYSGTAASHGFSAVPASGLYAYRIEGETMTIVHRDAANGTSNATSFAVNAPMNAATITDLLVSAIGARVDNGTTGAGAASIPSGSNVVTFYPNDHPAGSTSWTNSGGKRMITVTLSYPLTNK